MLRELLQFEWKFHSKQASFIVLFLLFLGYGVLAIIGGFQYLQMSTMYNDAYNLCFISAIISMGSICSCMFYCVNGVLRDSDHNAGEMIFSTGISQFNFFVSRFGGVFFSTLLMATLSLIGVFFGTQLPNLDPARLNAFDFSHYFWSFLTLLLPNVFICSAILFAITLLSRNAISTYITCFVLVAINWVSGFYINSPLVGGGLLSSPETFKVASMTDLIGLSAFFEQTQFLSPLEKNNHLISLSGRFLWNRVLWTLMAVFFLLGAYWLFSFRRYKGKVTKQVPVMIKETTSKKYSPSIPSTDTFKTTIATSMSLFKLDLKSLLRSVPFQTMLVIWMVMISLQLDYSIKGTAIYGGRYPTTELFVSLIMEVVPVIGLLLVVFYGGELVWKSRQYRFHQIIEGTPVKNGTLFLSKFVVLAIIPMLLILVSILIGVVFQLSKGYYNLQLTHYSSIFYYGGLQVVLYSVFVLLVQTLIANKYLGMIISGTVMLLFGPISESIGLEHPLLLFNQLPNMARAYSDFMGYGQYVHKFNWAALYWATLAVVFSLAIGKLWKRGTSSNFKSIFNRGLTKTEKALLTCLILAFSGIGGYIYYNTNVVNDYVTSAEVYDFNEAYERSYKKYDSLPVPKWVSVHTEVDIYPEESKYHVKAINVIANRSGGAMHEIFVTAPEPLESISLENATEIFHDPVLNTYLFRLNEPLEANQELSLEYSLTVAPKGFQVINAVGKKGSYIRNTTFSPCLGYVNEYEIEDEYERSSRGLPLRDNQVVNDSHLQIGGKFNFADVSFETIISTSLDQTALSSGKLIRHWRSADRSYYHYRSVDKISNMVAYQCARYEVRKEEHRGVAIELYHHPDHHQNVEEILHVAKITLDYCEENFGPYPFEYLRIGEMPVFGANGANGQAMPGVVSINEKVFKRNVDNPGTFNAIARVIIHEVAHQWWGELLTPKRIEGFMILSETLAKYSEMVLLEKLENQKMVNKLLRHNMRRYFGGRSREKDLEPPLYLSKHQQYLGYSKGAVVMSAIRELIGEKQLNLALEKLVTKYSNQPVATSLHLLEELYAVVPLTNHQLIDDWMKRVITYDLSVDDAVCEKLPTGDYEISLRINAQRFLTNVSGEEEQISINEPIAIGFFKDSKDLAVDDEVIYLEPHNFDKRNIKFKLVVKDKPDYVGIDPFFTRLDRNLADNRAIIDVN